MCPKQSFAKHANRHNPFLQLHFWYDLYESLCRTGDPNLRRAIQNERLHFSSVHGRTGSRILRLQLGRLPHLGVPVYHFWLRLTSLLPEYRLRIPL